MTKSGQIIDLSDLDTVVACDKGYRLELKHPDGVRPLGQFITVAGRDSNRHRDFVKKRNDDSMIKASENAKRGIDEPLRLSAVMEEEALDMLANDTIAFENVYFKGEMLKYSFDNAKMLYRELLFVRRQVDGAIVNLENFMSA